MSDKNTMVALPVLKEAFFFFVYPPSTVYNLLQLFDVLEASRERGVACSEPRLHQSADGISVIISCEEVIVRENESNHGQRGHVLGKDHPWEA